MISKLKSLFRIIRSEILYRKRIKINAESLQESKLIMTLLVKDEEDIVAFCIEHHLHMGVDYIFAADDGSTDNTLVILQKYEQKGLLHLVQLSKKRWNQAEVVNQLGEMAHSKFSNAIIFHCDADELWVPTTGNLKQELTEHPRITGLYVPVINVLLKDLNGLEQFPDNAIYYVVKPKEYNSSANQQIHNFFLHKYPAKVMYNLKNRYLYVSAGNHEIISNGKKVIMAKSMNITIFHFPVRSKKQFYNKVVKAKYVFKDDKNIQVEAGWHWRVWVEELNRGNFDQLYRNCIVSKENSKKLIKQKIIEKRIFSEVFPNLFVNSVRKFNFGTSQK